MNLIFFDVALLLAAFFCSLVAGFLFAFAVVAMPGIKRLSDGEFIRAFQEMDGVIQNNQPLFMIVWAGSVLTLLSALILGYNRLEGVPWLLLVSATAFYLLLVQLPTITINVPLNNRLQTFDSKAESAVATRAARDNFEMRWNRWNRIRTIVACLVSLLLITLLFML